MSRPRIVRRYGHAGEQARPTRTGVAVPTARSTYAQCDARSRSQPLGRAAKRDLVIGTPYTIWRSFEDAERRLRRHDVPVLPERSGPATGPAGPPSLAESTLIQDAIYMASMAISPSTDRRTSGDSASARPRRPHQIPVRGGSSSCSSGGNSHRPANQRLADQAACMDRGDSPGLARHRREHLVRTLVRDIVHRHPRSRSPRPLVRRPVTLHSMAGRGELRSLPRRPEGALELAGDRSAGEAGLTIGRLVSQLAARRCNVTPRLARMWVFTPPCRRTFWNDRTSASIGRRNSRPSTSLWRMRLTFARIVPAMSTSSRRAPGGRSLRPAGCIGA